MTLNRSIRWQGLDLKTLEHCHVIANGRDTRIRGTIIGPDFGLLYRIKLDTGTVLQVNNVNSRRAAESERVAQWEDRVWLSFEPSSVIVLED